MIDALTYSSIISAFQSDLVVALVGGLVCGLLLRALSS